MTVAVGCTALLGVLLFGLGFFVSAQRVRHGVIIGHNLDPLDPTHRAVRAHGNTAEYAPFLAIMFLWLGAREPAWWIQLIMVIATFSRYSIAAALILGTDNGQTAPRPLSQLDCDIHLRPRAGRHHAGAPLDTDLTRPP